MSIPIAWQAPSHLIATCPAGLRAGGGGERGGLVPPASVPALHAYTLRENRRRASGHARARLSPVGLVQRLVQMAQEIGWPLINAHGPCLDQQLWLDATGM